MKRVIAFGGALLGALWADAALAQVVEPRSYSIERFRLSLDRDGFLDAEWASVPAHLSWDLSLWLGYAKDPLVLSREDGAGDREIVARLVDHRVGGGLMGAIALFDWIQLGIDLPFVLSQGREEAASGVGGPLAELSSAGLGDLRIAPKIRLLTEREQGLGLAFIPAFTLPTASADAYLGEEVATFVPELALSRTLGALRLIGNLGLRLRRAVSVADLGVGTELLFRLGGAFRLKEAGGPPLELGLTLSVAGKADDLFSNPNESAVELLGGAGYELTSELMAFAAFGPGLTEGFGTPAWRILGGLRWSARQLDRDGDGIEDARDRCPAQREDRDEFEDGDGCPDPDNDADGVLDVDDDCPSVAGLQNLRGCPSKDGDGDGVAHPLDKCPSEPEDRDEFEDDDGCPDPDNDQDGILDGQDECPNEAGLEQNRGCPERDRDGDGVVDRLDNCPDEPGPVKNQGCKERQLVQISSKIEIMEKVFFGTGSSKIQARSHGLLDNVAKVLIAHPEIRRLRVEGHTDGRGGSRFNKRLSQRRADAVRKYLIERGVEANRLIAEGYGEDRPLETNKTAEGRGINRRVEFTIVPE